MARITAYCGLVGQVTRAASEPCAAEKAVVTVERFIS